MGREEWGAAGMERTAVIALHLLGGIAIPGVVVVLAVLLGPQSVDFAIFFEVLRPLFQSALAKSFSEQNKEKNGKRV